MKTSRLLWSLIRYRSLHEISGIFCGFLGQSAILFSGLLMQQLYDTLSRQPQFDQHLLLLICLLTVPAITEMVMHFIGIHNTIGIEYPIRGLLMRNVLERLFQLPGAKALPCPAGEALNILRDDTETVVNGRGFHRIIIPMLFAGIAVVILLRTNAQITLLVFLPLVAVTVLARQWMKRIERYRTASREAAGQVSGAIGEIVGAAQAIQVASAEASVVAHFHQLNTQRLTQILRERFQNDLVNGLLNNIVGIGTALILLLVALRAHSSPLSLGELALFLTYLDYIAGFLIGFGGMFGDFARARVSFSRLQRLMQGTRPEQLVEHRSLAEKSMQPEQPATPEQLETLTVNNLSYRYPESGGGIEQISFELHRGTLTVITGRIGSGKTTLLRAIQGLLPKNEGTILWNGETITDPGSFFMPKHSAYTPQIPHLFSTTLQENVLLNLPLSTPIEAAIQQAVMENDIAGFPKGLQTEIGTRGTMLSGGQAQRTATARMLARQAELYIFDDLSSALDVKTESQLWQRLFSAEAPKTYLVVAHRREVLHRAHNIIVIKEGRIEAQGTLEHLLEHSAEMQALWKEG